MTDGPGALPRRRGVLRAAIGAALLVSGLGLAFWFHSFRIRVRPERIERAHTLVLEANRLRAEGTAESIRAASRKYSEAAGLFRAAGERAEEVRARVVLGEIQERQGDLDEALDQYEQSLSIARRVDSPLLVSRAANRLGAVLHQRGENDLALPLFEEALAAAELANSDPERTLALFNLGYLQYSLGHMRDAIRFLERSAEWAVRSADPSMEARAQLHLGMAATMMEQRDRALPSLEKAARVYREIKDPSGEAQAVRVIGQLHSRLGETEEALERFEESRRLLKPLGDGAGEATVLNAIGQVYFDMGEKETALRYYNQALELNQRLQLRRREAATLLEIGQCHFDLGRETEALGNYEKALRIFRELRNRRLEADVLTQLGLLYRQRGDYENALRHFERAIALKPAASDPRGRAHTLIEAGSLFRRLDRTQRAMEFFDEARELSRVAADPTGEALALYQMAEAHRDAGEIEKALSEVERSLAIVESLRANVASPELRSSFLASVYDRYSFYIDLLLRLHQADPRKGFDAMAFSAAERARARTLLESLEEARLSIQEGIEPALVAEERALRSRLNEAAREQLLLSSDSDRETVKKLSAEVDSMTAEYDRLQAGIRARSPHYADLTQPQTVSLSEVRTSILDESTRLLAYTLGAERSFVWSVTREGHRVYVLPPRARIEEIARQAHRFLRSPGGSAGEAAVSSLSRILLDPIEGLFEKPRLLIVADGALSYVPFGALTLPDDDAPLITRLEIVRLPSVSIVPNLRSQRSKRSFARWVAVVADPVYETDDPRLDTGGVLPPHAGGPRTARYDFPRLLASRREAFEIAALAPEGQVQVVTGLLASREWVTGADFQDFRVVHFATHGILDDERPALSGLVLSLVDENGKSRDGFLRLNDIYNLKLPVDLVVLSACETGLGKEVRGEGLFSLVRGFMYAGAPSVLATSWKVDDEATADLMKLFYKGLFDGKTASESLREAQTSLWSAKRYQRPFYWAGFELQGDWR